MKTLSLIILLFGAFLVWFAVKEDARDIEPSGPTGATGFPDEDGNRPPAAGDDGGGGSW